MKSKEHYQRSFSDIRGTLSEADQAAEKAKVSLERYSDKIVEVLIEVIEAEPKKNA